MIIFSLGNRLCLLDHERRNLLIWLEKFQEIMFAQQQKKLKMLLWIY